MHGMCLGSALFISSDVLMVRMPSNRGMVGGSLLRLSDSTDDGRGKVGVVHENPRSLLLHFWRFGCRS